MLDGTGGKDTGEQSPIMEEFQALRATVFGKGGETVGSGHPLTHVADNRDSCPGVLALAIENRALVATGVMKRKGRAPLRAISPQEGEEEN